MNLRRQSPVVGAGKGEPSTGVRTTIGEADGFDFEILSALLVDTTAAFAGEMGPFYRKEDSLRHGNIAH
jgi:hypothetical protein